MSIGIGIGLFLRSSAVAAVIGTAWFSDPSLLASSTLPTMLAQYENDRYAVNGVEKTFHELHTFTRSTTKWVVGEAGTLIEVAVDEPAFDYSSGVREFLEEDLATNLVTHSNDVSDASWGKVNSGTGLAPVVSSITETAPDANSTASRVQLDLNGGVGIGDQSTINVNTVATVTSSPTSAGIWLKSATGTSYDLRIDFNGISPTVAPALITVTNTWQRFEIDLANAVDTQRYLTIRLRGTLGTSDFADILIWGAQQEIAETVSSTIPTSGAAVIRAADNCKIDGTRFSDFWNAPIGTVYADYAIDYSATDTDVVSVNDGTANESLDLFFNSSGNSRLNITDGGVLQTDITGAIIPEGNSNKIAAAYKLNDSNLASNSVASTTDTSVTIPTVTQLEIAAGRYKEIRYYPVRVTDSEISRITSPYTIPSYLADVWGDLALWLDADTSVDDTITETAGAVSQWDDKSRESNHAIQAVGADQFTTGLEQINSLNVLASDGISDYMNAPLFGNDATVFFVISDQRSPLKASNVNTIIATQKGGAVPQQGWGVLAKPYSSTTERKLSNEGNGASTQFYVDGIAAGAGVNPSPPATIEHNTPFVGTLVSQTHTDRGEVAIGALRLGSNFGEHLFAEVVILNTTISDIAFNAIGNGLATKWGTTWADI